MVILCVWMALADYYSIVSNMGYYVRLVFLSFTVISVGLLFVRCSVNRRSNEKAQ